MRYLNQPLPSVYPATIMGLDIETSMRTRKSHSDPFQDQILSIQVSDGKDCWIFSQPELYRSEIVPLLESPKVIKLIHNAGFDLQFLMHQLGAKPDKNSIYDTLLVERVLNTGRDLRHSLEEVAARRLGVFLNKGIRDTFRDHQGEFSEEQLTYMEQDVLHLPKLYELQMKDISSTGTGRVVRLENRLTIAVTRMTLAGVRFDTELWPEYKHEIAKIVAEVEQQLGGMLDLGGQQDLFGGVKLGFNPESTKQAQKILNAAGIEIEDTNEKTLTYFIDQHPNHPHLALIEKILEHREWRKRLSWNYDQEVSPVTGRIHATWNQVGADTGRFSCKEPNLQNVPRPEEGKPNFRMLFPPAENHLLAVADYSQQEPRILAQLSGDPTLRQACNTGDVYVSMAEIMYGEKIEKRDPRRYDLKQGVLSDFYGASAETISRNKHLPIRQVEQMKERSHKAFAHTHDYMRQIQNMASVKGVTRTLLGRPRYYQEIEAGLPPRTAFWNESANHPVQGSGADALKMAFDYFDDTCQEHGWDASVVMVVHDEIVAETSRADSQEVYYNLVGCMEQAGRELCPDVPLIADGVISERWDKT